MRIFKLQPHMENDIMDGNTHSSPFTHCTIYIQQHYIAAFSREVTDTHGVCRTIE
jgi:hypothetical protein